MDNDDIFSDIKKERYVIRNGETDFLFEIELEKQENIDILTIQASNKNSKDTYKTQLTTDDLMASGLTQLKSLFWFKLIIQASLDKLMKPEDKGGSKSSMYQIQTELLTIGSNRLTMLNKIRDMSQSNLTEYRTESKLLQPLHLNKNTNPNIESSSLDIGALLIVVNFKAKELKLLYHIGIQLPRLIPFNKKDYRTARSVIVKKLITERKAVIPLQPNSDPSSQFNVTTPTRESKASPGTTLSGLKKDISEVESMIEELNKEKHNIGLKLVERD